MIELLTNIGLIALCSFVLITIVSTIINSTTSNMSAGKCWYEAALDALFIIFLVLLMLLITVDYDSLLNTIAVHGG